MFFDDYKEHSHAKLDLSLLWEFDIPASDFYSPDMRNEIVGRVVERGCMDDWYAILNMYGVETVVEEIKALAYLNDKDMNFVCTVFKIPKEKMKCYLKRQLHQAHWNY